MITTNFASFFASLPCCLLRCRVPGYFSISIDQWRRQAISSGMLAAHSLFLDQNYDRLWQRELQPQMEATVVNRALYSLVGNRGYDWLIRRIVSRPNLRRSLQRQYQLSRLKRLLGPWARHRLVSQRRDVSCDHIDCHCIYCRSACCEHDQSTEERK